MSFFQKSLNVKREAGDTLGQALIYNNLVRVYRNLELFDKAIEASKQAIYQFKEIRAPHRAAVATRNLARLYRNIENIYSSREFFQQAIDMFEKCDESDQAAEVRKELTSLSGKLGLPWWIWLPIILVILLVILGLVGLIMD